MCLNPGDILCDRYLIERELGRGGFGVTYLARGQFGDRPVVVKVIPQQSDDPIVLERGRVMFDREVEALQKLGRHPQIPELFDSGFDSCEERGHFYLIQEYIEGHPLKNEFIPDRPWSEAETLALLEDILEVLECVHQAGSVHRDIHPSNLIRRATDGKIVLIDFGAVKEIGTLERTESQEITTHAIGTPGYMPPEQARGITQPSSDIYAVGCIGVQALTGLYPSQFQSQFQRDGDGNFILSDLPISLKSIEILERMVRYHFNDRYPSATEALEAVRKLEKPWWCDIGMRLVMGVGIAIGLTLVVGGGTMAVARLRLGALPTCSKIEGDNLSCGEEFLVAGISSEDNPESLIYENNARLETQLERGDRIHTIAVVVPLEEEDDWKNPGLEVLRGVAQAQDAINQRDDLDLKLRVLVANDNNRPNRAVEMAKQLGRRSDVLAVVGHSTSATTQAALPTYQQQQQVLISATSTSEQLMRSENPYFFRTVPGDEEHAKALTEYLFPIAKKVAIFANDRPASASLHDSFSKSFTEKGGEAAIEIELSGANFDAQANLNSVREARAEALLLFPDARVDEHAYDNALNLLEANRNRDWVAGGTGLYSTDILKRGERAQKLVVSVPWHSSNSTDSQFIETARELWGETVSAAVSWRTATAYDATLVLAEAIEAQANLNPLEVLRAALDPRYRRVRLQETLADPNFAVTGTTGTIQFDREGDRLETSTQIELVRVLPCANQPFGFAFVPIEFESAAEAGLACYRSTFSQISEVPQGTFFYGGSTIWARIRDRIDPVIQKAQPGFEQRYLPPASGIAPSSGQGIAMLIDDRLDIAQSSRQIKDEEHERAKQRGFKLREIPVAVDGVAVVVNPSLNVPGLTVAQFCDIYAGQITNWSQVGGPNLDIQPYLKPNQQNSFCQSIDRRFTQEVATTTLALNQIDRNPGGLFWSSASLLVEQCTVKALPIGNKPNEWVSPYREPFVPPERCPEDRNRVNAEAIRSGEYPLTRRLRVIVKENGQAAQAAGEAYGNLLLTEEGQEMLEGLGFVRLK
ncbi:MAG: substrate-binding domain-containing protein [Cyanobacteriota bacterium]|nr:substrate-binding domain-containing protein [Cyanobacteriota bacterium]